MTEPLKLVTQRDIRRSHQMAEAERERLDELADARNAVAHWEGKVAENDTESARETLSLFKANLTRLENQT